MLLEAIAAYLAAAGAVIYSPDPDDPNQTFIDHLPAAPDTAVALFSTGGPPSSGKHGYDTYGFQVRTRARIGLDAYAAALAIYNLLHGLDNAILPGGTYVINCMGQQAGPVNIGYDGNDRQEYTLNYLMEIRNLTVNRE
jgi:hypothetical protein